MASTPVYLGIEIGGTKLQVGVGPGDGTLAGLWRSTVDVAAGPEGIRRQLTNAVPELLASAGISRQQLRGLGIGFGGPVDHTQQRIIRSHQIAGWDDFPLGDWLADVVGVPAVLGNDADVAGLGEALHGAGKGLSPIFYVTIGSGIGGGFILDGEIYTGVGRGAAEIGHLRMGGERRLPEPLEQLASGWAIGRRATEAIRHYHSPTGELAERLARRGELTARDVAEAAAVHDPLAYFLLRETCTYLGEALCQVIALLCPRRIVIGGGVSLMGEKLLFDPLREFVAQHVFQPFAGLTDIVPAALGEEVVVHGALALARRRFSSS